MSIRCLVALLLAVGLTGCATYRNTSQVQDGPGLEFKAADLKDFRENQNSVLEELGTLAGADKSPKPEQWSDVILAGMDYADSKCEAYMHALFRLNRDKKTVISQTGLLGTATAGLMGAAKSAAEDVAAVAVLFGLTSSTVDNLTSNLLYELDPSSVRTLVKELQSKFRGGLPTDYSSRPAAMRVIRAYAMLCVPANIEAEVNLAVKGSAPGGKAGNAETGQPPEVTNAVSVNVSDPALVRNTSENTAAADLDRKRAMTRALGNAAVTPAMLRSTLMAAGVSAADIPTAPDAARIRLASLVRAARTPAEIDKLHAAFKTGGMPGIQ
jgi:hypothetical protein